MLPGHTFILWFPSILAWAKRIFSNLMHLLISECYKFYTVTYLLLKIHSKQMMLLLFIMLAMIYAVTFPFKTPFFISSSFSIEITIPQVLWTLLSGEISWSILLLKFAGKSYFGFKKPFPPFTLWQDWIICIIK